MNETRDDFKEACLPLVDYLNKNHHPHMKVIVDQLGGELLEGQLTTGKIGKYAE